MFSLVVGLALNQIKIHSNIHL